MDHSLSVITQYGIKVAISDLQNLLFFLGHRKHVNTDVRVPVDNSRWALSNGVYYAIVGQSTAELRPAKISPYKLYTNNIEATGNSAEPFCTIQRQNKVYSMSYLAQLVPQVYLKQKLR